MQLQTPENACISCGLDKNPDKRTDFNPENKYCFYCWHRSNHNTMKMIILDIISQSKNRMSLLDVIGKLNKFKYIGYDVEFNSTKKRLIRFTKRERKYNGIVETKGLGLLTASKSTSVRPEKGGRKVLLYHITKKGIRVLKRYKKRWLGGLPLQAKKRGKKRKKQPKFEMNTDRNERASAIRGRIVHQSDIYEHIFIRRRNHGVQNL